jgi:hypothetical protein
MRRKSRPGKPFRAQIRICPAVNENLFRKTQRLNVQPNLA